MWGGGSKSENTKAFTKKRQIQLFENDCISFSLTYDYMWLILMQKSEDYMLTTQSFALASQARWILNQGCIRPPLVFVILTFSSSFQTPLDIVICGVWHHPMMMGAERLKKVMVKHQSKISRLCYLWKHYPDICGREPTWLYILNVICTTFFKFFES